MSYSRMHKSFQSLPSGWGEHWAASGPSAPPHAPTSRRLSTANLKGIFYESLLLPALSVLLRSRGVTKRHIPQNILSTNKCRIRDKLVLCTRLFRGTAPSTRVWEVGSSIKPPMSSGFNNVTLLLNVLSPESGASRGRGWYGRLYYNILTKSWFETETQIIALLPTYYLKREHENLLYSILIILSDVARYTIQFNWKLNVQIKENCWNHFAQTILL